MLFTLAFRHLVVRKRRGLFLLLGFALGVGVMIVLLSVGEAMVTQSRDVALVGGGEATVLPQGIDVEAMRTGGVGGMFAGIAHGRFVARMLVGGPRHADVVRTLSPTLENHLVYVAPLGPDGRARGAPVPVRAGAEIPSRARVLVGGLAVRAGAWRDTPADSAWIAPTAQQLYDQLDRFHLPVVADSTWGEWHYFNVVTAPDEWWYLTFLAGGDIAGGRGAGAVLVTHRRPDGRYERFTGTAAPGTVAIDTAGADLVLGADSVTQRDGVYRLRARARGPAGALTVDLAVRPLPNRYFPPVELSQDRFVSGYVVPALAASATGRLCVGARCAEAREAPAYHDHNWGVWRGVTWEWGNARGGWSSLLYGGVRGPEGATGTTAAPFFLAVADSLGIRQVLRFRRIAYEGAVPATLAPELRGAGVAVDAPARFTLVAVREPDTVRVRVRVADALASHPEAAGPGRYFVQMRGAFTLDGRVAGAAVADTGSGFFETYVGAAAGGRPTSVGP